MRCLQVCTLDLWDRCTTEGYGWLQLGSKSCPGSSMQYVSTWKPLGEQQQLWQGAGLRATECGCTPSRGGSMQRAH